MTLVNHISAPRRFARALATAAIALATVAASDAPAPAHSQATAKRCASVPFTPASDDLAAEIRATGVSCAFARRFIRDSNGRPPRSYRGFACARHRVDEGSMLPHTRYRCSRGTKTIRWKRF